MPVLEAVVQCDMEPSKFLKTEVFMAWWPRDGADHVQVIESAERSCQHGSQSLARFGRTAVNDPADISFRDSLQDWFLPAVSGTNFVLPDGLARIRECGGECEKRGVS